MHSSKRPIRRVLHTRNKKKLNKTDRSPRIISGQKDSSRNRDFEITNRAEDCLRTILQLRNASLSSRSPMNGGPVREKVAQRGKERRSTRKRKPLNAEPEGAPTWLTQAQKKTKRGLKNTKAEESRSTRIILNKMMCAWYCNKVENASRDLLTHKLR